MKPPIPSPDTPPDRRLTWRGYWRGFIAIVRAQWPLMLIAAVAIFLMGRVIGYYAALPS